MSGSVKWFVGFLCIMAMLTFISRQIYTSKLAIVTTGKMKNQAIAHNIRAAGTVECDSLKPVFFPQGVLADKICVHQGDSVNPGDVLAVLNEKSLKKRIQTLEEEIETKLQTDGASAGDDAVPIFTESGMRIIKTAVKNGQKVKKGDLLFQVDTDHLLRLINSLEADRNKDIISRNGLINAMNAPQPTDEFGSPIGGSSGSQEQIDSLTISINEQQKKIDRYLEIYYNNGEIRTSAEGTVTSLSGKVGDVTGDSSALAVISSSGKVSSTVSAARDEIKELKAILEAGGNIISEETGVVSSVTVTAGSIAAENNAALFIADTTGDGLYFSAMIEEKQAKYLAIGDKVTVALRNGRLFTDEAEIRSITNSGENFRVDVVIDNAMFGLSEDKSISYGEVGELKTSSKTSDKYYCISKEAVHGSGAEKYVYVAEETEGFFGPEYHAVKHSITTADENDTYFGMTSAGIPDEAMIIMSSSKNLTDGARIRLNDSGLMENDSTEA